MLIVVTLITLALLFWYLFPCIWRFYQKFQKIRAILHSGAPPHSRTPHAKKTQKMICCAQCLTFIPEHEAIGQQQPFFCSDCQKNKR